MYGDLIVGKLKVRIWWKIFYLTQWGLFFLIIASIAINNWVYASIEGKIFKGSISKSGSHDGMSYYSLSLSYCELSKQEHNDSDESLCLLYSNLFKGFWCFVILEAVSLLSIFIWYCAMMRILAKGNAFKVGYVFCGISYGSHILACALWYGQVQAGFINKCENNSLEGKMPRLCTDIGPLIALSNAGLFTFLIIGYIMIVKISYKKHILPQYQVAPRAEISFVSKETSNLKSEGNAGVSISESTPQTTAETTLALELKRRAIKRKSENSFADFTPQSNNDNYSLRELKRNELSNADSTPKSNADHSPLTDTKRMLSRRKNELAIMVTTPKSNGENSPLIDTKIILSRRRNQLAIADSTPKPNSEHSPLIETKRMLSRRRSTSSLPDIKTKQIVISKVTVKNAKKPAPKKKVKADLANVFSIN